MSFTPRNIAQQNAERRLRHSTWDHKRTSTWSVLSTAVWVVCGLYALVLWMPA